MAHPRPVHTLAFSPGGRLLLTGCEDGQPRLYLTSTALPASKPLLHEGPLTAVAFSPDGAAVTAIADSKQGECVRLWQMSDERAFGRPLTLPGELLTVGFTPDNRALLAGKRGESIRRWELDRDDLRGVPTHRDLVAAGLPDAAVDGATTVRPGTRGEPAVYSPDRSLMMAAFDSQMPRLLDAATGEAFDTPLGRDDVCSVAFSADGARLAADGAEGVIVLWNVWSPWQDSVELVRSKVEALVGAELVAHESVQVLTPEALEQRRRRIAELESGELQSGN